MLFFSLPVHDAALFLNGGTVTVRINGVDRKLVIAPLTKEVCWTDDSGERREKIIQMNETGGDKGERLVSFTCANHDVTIYQPAIVDTVDE